MMAWATGEQAFKTAAANYWTQFGFGAVQPSFDWDTKNAGIAVSERKTITLLRLHFRIIITF